MIVQLDAEFSFHQKKCYELINLDIHLQDNSFTKVLISVHTHVHYWYAYISYTPSIAILKFIDPLMQQGI